ELDHETRPSDLQLPQSAGASVQIKGGLQFSPSTWKAYGGSGAAHEASRDEQIAVAERVQAAQGWKAWPACSKRLGLR
ncbi:transglycosylase family protein, partial [Pseudonocardia sp. EV170527-09]